MSEPLRMCAGCHERVPKKELIRIVRKPSGEVLMDAGGKTPGRGAYICRKTACLKRVQKNGTLARMLGAEITDETYQILTQALECADE